MAILQEMRDSIYLFIIVVILMTAGAIALDGFQQNVDKCTSDSAIFNSSYPGAECRNQTGGGSAELGATTYAFNITQSGNEGLESTSDQTSTIGLMIGLAAILSIVAGAFYYFAR